MAEGRQINILANIYNNIQRGLELKKTLIMAQGSGRSGKTYNILETLALECLQHPIRERTIIDPTTHKTMILQEPLLVSVVRKSLPVLKRSAYRDFRTIMISMGAWNERSMNKTDWIWNAQLTRSFLNGSLIAKLKGYDILQQLENTHYRMNAQGRTESWHNGIPRYVMLSLSWRFNVMPKKKKQ